MNTFLSWLVGGIMSGAMLLCAITRADEEKVPLNEVPKAVMKVVKAKFPEGELVGASKETEKGKTIYEVSLKDQGHKVDVEVTAEGKIVAIEKEIAAKDLPEAVATALNKKYPGAKIQKVEEITKSDQVSAYEAVIVTEDKKRLEVSFNPEGKFLAEEKQNEKEDK
jgi:hypothetical protein